MKKRCVWWQLDEGTRELTERGAILVEFSLGALMLVALTSAMLNLGQWTWQLQSLSNAMRHGARSGSYFQSMSTSATCTQIATMAQSQANQFVSAAGANSTGRWRTPVARVENVSYGGVSFGLVSVTMDAENEDPSTCLFCLDSLLSGIHIGVGSYMPLSISCS